MNPTPAIRFKDLERCPLCGESARNSLVTCNRISAKQCRSCRLIYLDPCPDPRDLGKVYETSDSLATLHGFLGRYYEYGGLDEKSETLADYLRMLELLEKWLPPGRRDIFEVGFGNGLFLAAAQKREWQVNGIDISAKNRVLAKERYLLELQHGFFEDFEINGRTYDAVAMLDVIEHQEAPHLFLQKAHRMLRPKGLLLLATPNASSFLHSLALWLYRLSGGVFKNGVEKIFIEEHLAYYNRQTVSELARRNGFRIVDDFQCSTDLERYCLKPNEAFTASVILRLGKLLRRENRFVVVGEKL